MNYCFNIERLLRLISIQLGFLLVSSNLTAQPSDWTVVGSDYTYTESMVLTVEEINNNIPDPAGFIGAFDTNGVCRGVANFNNLSVGLRAFLTIYGNLPEEEIQFRIYDTQEDKVFLSCSAVNEFQAEAVVGSVSEPVVVVYDEATDFDLGQTPNSVLCNQGEGVNVIIKIFLQGAYQNGEMTTLISNIMPLSHPFLSEYNGTENATSIPADVVDWILVELRKPAETVVARRAAFLRKDGVIVDLDGFSPVFFGGTESGDYFVAVKHRNHLGVMTSSTIQLID